MNKITKAGLKVLTILLMVQVSYAQIKSISGTIRNASTLEPLPYANLVIKGTYLGGTSNVDGYFYLSGLDHDSLQVVCSYIGYNTFVEKFYFKDETHIIIPIAMTSQTLGGESVLVEDSLLVTPEINIIVQVPKPAKPTHIALKESDGLVDEGFSYELTPPMRWLHPTGEYTHYIIDGVPVENSRHLYNVYPPFNLDAVKHIEDQQAGSLKQTTTDHGNATELLYREGNRAETDVRAILGLVESGLTTSGPHPAGGSWYFSGRRVDFDAIYSLSTTQTDSVYRRFRPDYYFYDLNGKITFDIDDNTKVAGNSYLTFDKLHWLGDQGRSAHSSWYNGFMSARLQYRFNPRLTTQTNLYSKTYHSFLRADQLPLGLDYSLDGDFANTLNTYGVSSQADYYLGNNNMVFGGMSLERLSSELVFVDSGVPAEDQGWVFKGRAGYRYTLPYNLSTDLGIQAMYSAFSENFALNPGLLVNWEPSNIYNAYFSIEQSTQVIRENSLSTTLSQPLLEILIPVDTSLALPEQLNLSIGGQFMPIIGFDLKAELFTKILTNPTLVDSHWTGNFSDQSKWLEIYDSGLVNGFNLSLEKRTPGIHTLAKYRFSRSQLTDILGNKDLLPGHREHEFYFILDEKFRENMGYRADLTLASGKRYMEGDQSWNWSTAYHRADISFYRDITWDLVDGRVSLKLLNITNGSNLEFSQNDWVTNSLQDRAFVLLPFTPTINFDFVF